MNRDKALATLILVFTLIAMIELGCIAEDLTTNNAPTGVFVSIPDRSERFTIELKTDGTYAVLVSGLVTNSQSGCWKWDKTKRQFLLTPSTNGSAFSYQLRVLRVDPRQADTLQWIPLGGIGSTQGAVDYVRFKRKDH